MAETLRIQLPPVTLRLMAVERLREAIIAGHFPSGARLIERTLCDQLGVSRSVVREAIRYLEAEGLVEIIPRVGPIVARLDWNGASQIYAIRRLLESAAAADCARRAGDDTKYALQVALHHLEAVVFAADTQAIYRATTRFYEIIFQSAGHDVAWDIVQRLNGRISRLRAITLSTTDRKVAGPVHMARICAAIRAGNAPAAARAVDEHLTEAAEIARQHLQAERLK